MKKMKIRFVLVGMLLLSIANQAQGKVIRATEMGTVVWSDLNNGKLNGVIVEFRQGDELPMSFEAQGDFIETRQTSTSYVGVKRNFWLRLDQNSVEMSLDGTTFKKISDVVTGSLDAGAGASQNGGSVDAINILFKAFIK